MSAPTLNFTAVDLAIAKLELAPADILVAKVNIPITEEVRQRIAQHLTSLRTDGGSVAVLDDKIDVSVIKAIDDDGACDADDEESGW